MTTTWVGREIVSKLAAFELDEEAISARRSVLHRRIDALYLDAPLAGAQLALLDLLEDEERDISAQRRRLHIQIDELRRQAGLTPIGRSAAQA